MFRQRPTLDKRSHLTPRRCKDFRDVPHPAQVSLFLILVVTASLLLPGCSQKEAGEDAEANPVVTVDVAPVVNGTIRRKIAANGVLFPLQQAAIVPKISAPIVKFYVDRGSHVRAGQLLAELENQDLAGAAAESRANYEQAQATYEIASRGTLPEELHKTELEATAAKEALEAQQKVYESRQALFQQGAISAKEVNEALVSVTQARNQHEIAQKHLEALQRFGREQELKAAAAQVDAAKGKQQSAEAQLGYSKIVSPIDGVVTDRPLFPGEIATSGSAMITVMDISQVVARPHISQREAAQIKVGDAATLSVPGQDGDFPGKVTVVSPALDPNSTTVEVWVQAANPGERLKPGTSVRVEIVAATVPSALLIPAAALLTGDDGSTSVMVVDASNQPRKKRVAVGIRDGDEVQITEGLQSGERVVTAGAFELDRLDPEVLAKTKVQLQAPKEEEEEEDEDEGK